MIDKVIENAENGRGLWIGLFPVAGTKVHAFGREQADPHVTLAHLGRKNDSERVSRALAAATIVGEQHEVFTAKTNGHARFNGGGREGNPLVVLLRGAELRRIHDDVAVTLDSLGVSFDRSFDFLPHVTVGRAPSHDAVGAEAPAWQSITFTHLVLVCGDAREYIGLKLGAF